MKQLFLFAAAIACAGQTGSAVAAPSSQSSTTRDSGQPTTRPAGTLALDLGARLAAEPGEGERHRDQRESLDRRVEAAHKPVDQAAAHLELANWLLAVPTARPATRWLVGLEDEQDRATLAECARQAVAHLERARTALQAATAPADRKQQRPLERVVDNLAPFAKFFATADRGTDPQTHQAAWLEAALELAPLREADDPQLAACALLWQSFGWELAGRRERALVSLGPPLTKPEQLPYDFASRLLRCRILADAGQYAAATALTIRMRALCKQWFPDAPPDQLQARQMIVALLEYRAGRDWLKQLKASDAPAASALEQMRLTLLASPLFLEPKTSICHLPTAVPILIGPPGPSSWAPSTGPASTPASAPGPAVMGQPASLDRGRAAAQSAPASRAP